MCYLIRSDSSVGDLGDLTPCNTSPNLPAVMSFRSLHRDDTEEMWRFQLCLLFEQTPNSSLHVFHLMYKLIKVRIIRIFRNEADFIISYLSEILKYKTRIYRMLLVKVSRSPIAYVICCRNSKEVHCCRHI